MTNPKLIRNKLNNYTCSNLNTVCAAMIFNAIVSGNYDDKIKYELIDDITIIINKCGLTKKISASAIAMLSKLANNITYFKVMLVELLQYFDNKCTITIIDVCNVFSKGLYSYNMLIDLIEYIKSSKIKYKKVIML